MTISLKGYVVNNAGNPKANLTVEAWWHDGGAAAHSTTTDANGMWTFAALDSTKQWKIKVIEGAKVYWIDARNKLQLTSLDLITDMNVDTVNEHTVGAGVTVGGVKFKGGTTTALDYGQSFQAIVTTYTDTTHFKASGLTGKGDGFFIGYYAYVVWDAGGLGAAPQTEAQPISAYTSLDGTFTHTAFTTPLATTDEVLIIHPYLWYLLELKSTNIPADIDTLLARLTAARAGYLDNLSGGAVALAASWTAALATALGNYTAARAAYLDNINQAGLLQVTAARAALLDQITAIRLAELDAANIPADVDTLLARLTALRAGYLDNLSAGAVALQTSVDDLEGRLTALRAGYLDNLSAGAVALQASVDDLEGRLTAARAGYLDNLNTPTLAYGLSFKAIVTTYTDTTHFKASGLTGKGDDFFNGYYAYVVWDAGGLGAAPQGEAVAISDYVSADGTFTHAAFTTPVAVTDEVLIIHPYAWYLLELKSTNIPADIDTLLARLSAIRAGYLDNLSGGAVALAASWTAALATALGNYTAARAGYLDNINQAGLLQVTAARAALLDQITAVRLAELDAANLPADVDTLLARLTALRAGYLDNLSGGAVALAASWTAALATALGNYTAARAGYLDNINQAGLLQLTAARAALLDQITALRLAELDAANLPADVDTLLARLTALRAGYLDNLSGGAAALAASWTAALATALGNYTAARAAYLDNLSGGAVALNATVAKTAELISAGVIDFNATAKTSIQTAAAAALAATVNKRQAGVPQIFQKAITSAANAGDVTLATITTQGCVIESIVVKAVTAAQIDLTSAAVAGGAAKVIVFLSATDAAKANIDAIDEQKGWTGVVELAAAKTIIMSLVGTGATAVDLLVTITYHSAADGGYLA